MADAQSDADKIRQKRLAKLAGSQQPSTSSQSSSAQEKPAEKPPVEPSKSNEAANPFQQLKMAPVKAENDPPKSKINIRPSSTAMKRPADSLNTTRAASESRRSEHLEEWTNRIISSIFKVTLKPTTANAQGPLFLGEIRTELEEQNVPVLFTTELLDQVVLKAVAGYSSLEPLDYLLGCWKRVVRISRSPREKLEETPERTAVVQEARRIVMNYSVYAVTMPDLFERDTLPLEGNPLAKHLLVDPENERGVCTDFLQECVTRLGTEDAESVEEMLVGAVEQLCKELSQLTMVDNYRPYMLALRSLARYPAIITVLTNSPKFFGKDVPAERIETDTLLGPFFALSPLQDKVALDYFSSVDWLEEDQNPANIASIQKPMRMTLQNHQEELFEITNAFIRARVETRNKTLDWFAFIVNSNHKRAGMQPDYKTISSDGFMLNVTTILTRLCEPFMDATFSKVDRIDVNYLRRSPRVAVKDETKINADQNTSDKFYENTADGSNNFISEVFFLTVAAHHYGQNGVHTNLKNMQRLAKDMRFAISRMEADRGRFVSNPAMLNIFETRLKQHKNQANTIHAVIQATDGAILDELNQARSMQFMRYVIVWLLRVASGVNYPKEQLSLPLQAEASETFNCLPEYILTDITEQFKYITRRMPHIMTSTQCTELVHFCITFLRNSEYIKNPFSKAGLVTILFSGVWPLQGRPNGLLGDILVGSDFCMKNLLHAIMKFYIEAENTGRSQQFYEKFNIRYEIFEVIKSIWKNHTYRENLNLESKQNVDFFVRFVNLLMNDVTFFLDESFTNLSKIHELSHKLASWDPSIDGDDNQKKEREEELSTAERMAKNWTGLANQSLYMLKLFTEALGEAFTMPEVVQRLADMLDYNLDALVGPKQRNLKVYDPTKYDWNPKHMVSELIDVFLNLSTRERFVTAVARDGRSYKPENFKFATGIMKRYALKSEEQISKWEKLASTIALTKQAEEEAEEDLGDIPDEFLDPLMYTLMEDPVILPSSRTTIDRSTIRSHLLSDPTDPFNRVPLRIEDVLPDEGLKGKIEAFKAEKKSARLERLKEVKAQTEAADDAAVAESAGGGGDAMDTSG